MGKHRIVLFIVAILLMLVGVAYPHDGTHTYLVADGQSRTLVHSYVVQIDGDNATVEPQIVDNETVQLRYNVEHIVPNLCSGLEIRVKACAFPDGKCCSDWSNPIYSPNLTKPSGFNLFVE